MRTHLAAPDRVLPAPGIHSRTPHPSTTVDAGHRQTRPGIPQRHTNFRLTTLGRRLCCAALMPAVALMALAMTMPSVLFAMVRAEAVLACGAGAAGSSTGLFGHD